mmetsp:Transcript_72984/g.144636  ORF Transcript_72984/g.144636 Transcript_72984/m.144636 type:complete len:246 (+) Transcript_72984:57-794(+)
MLSLAARPLAWDEHGPGCQDASQRLVASDTETSDLEEEVLAPDAGNWLLRLGAPAHGFCTKTQRRSRIPRSERARHAILTWRLEKPYLFYCFACFAVTAFLLGWNLVKGYQHHWNLPQWQHHRWEEALEVTIGTLIVVETILTMRVLGLKTFLSNAWCIFDLAVALLTVISVCYGLEHLGRQGEICEANVPLLMVRFVLQPARVVATASVACRVSRMQNRVDELQVDFNALPHGATAFASMQEMT